MAALQARELSRTSRPVKSTAAVVLKFPPKLTMASASHRLSIGYLSGLVSRMRAVQLAVALLTKALVRIVGPGQRESGWARTQAGWADTASILPVRRFEQA